MPQQLGSPSAVLNQALGLVGQKVGGLTALFNGGGGMLSSGRVTSR